MKDVFSIVAKTSKKIVTSLFLLLTLAACSQSHTVQSPDSRIWRYTSFLKIDINMISLPIGCVSIPEGTMCSEFTNAMEPITMSGTGSGMVVRHNRDMTFILTAAHVCRDRRNHTVRINTALGDAEISVDQRVSLISVDYYGNRHQTTVFSSDNENDICIVMSPGTWGEAVPIAFVEPEIGEHVYNVAAPLGIFETRMVPIFDGRFIGNDSSGRRFYTIPTGPGSSGSSILNDRGEIVGMIHSAFTNFENIAISSSLSNIRQIVRTIDQE